MDKLEQLTANAEEIVTIDELKTVLNKDKPRGYIGFEPSGTVHIGCKICTNKIKDFLYCGFDFTILLADWHAFINDKLGGDIEKIKLCGKYMEDCFAAMGVYPDKVTFVYASDYVNDPKYWELVLRTSKATSLARVKRAMNIMGRDADEADKDLSKLFYPAMQVSDIFYLDLDVAYGGMDQRHAHMLARDVSKKISKKPPVAIHTPLLTRLQAGGRMDPTEVKMSKSKPDSMISIHDDPESVKRKINKAFCPEKMVDGNPVLEICKYVIFPELKDDIFLIKRSEKFGGNLEFKSYNELEKAYVSDLHPLDLKNATAGYINKILEPVHRYFEKHPDNYKKMKNLGIIKR
ncbi:MAG: tyrosine--tRNA ligase [Thermoplasmatales archaeon]|nr:MAG: tyrosine--tRNA ligase [Thermoplasmatales archaeon]